MKTKLYATAMLGASLFTLQDASAADMSTPRYTKAPVVSAPMYDWSGFYVGAHVGYAWGDEHDNLSQVIGVLADGYDVKGAIGGGHVGYNWQFGRTVFGFEGDFDGSGLRGGQDFDNFSNTRVYESIGRLSMKSEWQASIRARLGYAQDDWLFYVTGGAAFADVNASLDIARLNVTACEGVCVFNGVTTSDRNVLTGWTVGGGVEHALAQHWLARAEFRYSDFGAKTFNFNDNSNVAVPTRIRFDQFSSTVGVSYRF